EKLISDAESTGSQIYILGTAEPANVEIGPYDSKQALERLQALKPRPIPVTRQTAFKRLTSSLPEDIKLRLAFMSDGLAQPHDAQTFAQLDESGQLASVLWYDANLEQIFALTGINNQADHLEAVAIRPETMTSARTLTASAYDDKGRRIAEAPLSFAVGSTQATARFSLPVELRNDFRAIRIDGVEQFYGKAEAGSRLRSEEHTSELQSREKLVCRHPPEKQKYRKGTKTDGS